MKTRQGFMLDYIRTWSQAWDDRIAMIIVGNNEGNKGKRQYFDGEKFIDIKQEGGICEPAFLLRIEQAQELMNSLWDSGVRPSQANGSIGQLDAVKYHLEDMRKLVFNKKD